MLVFIDVTSPGSPRRGDFRSQSSTALFGAAQESFAAASMAFTNYAASREPWMQFVSMEDPASEAFRRASIAHLSRSEAFISGFRTQSSLMATGRQTRSTVRDLLLTTRLLIDSPLSARTQFRPVFQDLELVLVRMALVTDATFSEDREQIEATLEKKKLLSRIRELIPQISTSNAN